MSMFSYKEALATISILAVMFFVVMWLVFPPANFLSGIFLQFIPDFLQHTSLINYFQLHLSFFTELIIPVGLLMIILYLWRQR